MRAPDLTSTIDLFDEYYRLMDKKEPNFNTDLASEGRKRLEQLKKILNILQNYDDEHRNFYKKVDTLVHGGPPIPRGVVKKHSDDMEMAEMYAECFYYIGFRLRSLVRILPNLNNFECVGIRNTRNKLIEHPEKQSRVYIQSFAIGDWGPVIKAARYEDQKDIYPANPLYEDALEMKNSLEKSLQRVISK